LTTQKEAKAASAQQAQSKKIHLATCQRHKQDGFFIPPHFIATPVTHQQPALQHAEGISKMDFFIPPHFIATPVTHQQPALQHAEGISKARKN
jgi:hypothetical protein